MNRTFTTWIDGKKKDVKYWGPSWDDAIRKLRPGAMFDMSMCYGEPNFYTYQHEVPPPTRQEIDAEMEILYREWDYYEYERSRNNSYPDGETQFDMLFHDIEEGNLSNGRWITAIREVKNKFPKPDCSVEEFVPPPKKELREDFIPPPIPEEPPH